MNFLATFFVFTSEQSLCHLVLHFSNETSMLLGQARWQSKYHVCCITLLKAFPNMDVVDFASSLQHH